jgi:hypothetical protein
MSASLEPPTLAPPGAGLPAVQLLFSRFILAVASAVDSRDSALRRFNAEACRIRKMVDQLDETVGVRRVLVPRLLGLEDSSRFWSPYMVVEHLVIVDTNMFRIMTDLMAGRLHPDEARIEDFKPAPSVGRASLVTFDKLVTQFNGQVPQWPDLRTLCRHVHPWFGPLDAHRWLSLAGLHHGIHRRQLKRILAGAVPVLAGNL